MNEIQTKTLYTRAQFPIKTEEEWLELNPVLRKGEIVFVQFFDGMKTAKIGDGETPFYLLPYVDGPYEELETRDFSNNILVNDDSMAETIRIDSFGGMTYKCSNLLPYSYYDTTITRKGITFTVNSDNTITANGTATETAHFDIVKVWDTCDIKAGTYCLSGVPIGGSGTKYYMNIAFKNAANTKILDVDCSSTKSFTLEDDAVAIYLRINIMSGTTVNNLVFKPMLNVGTTALPYEPYFEGLRDTKPTEIKIHGANLVDYVTFFESLGFTKQSNGYWLGYNKTGTIFENTIGKSGSISMSFIGKTITAETSEKYAIFMFDIYYTDGTDERQARLLDTDTTDYKFISAITNSNKTVKKIRTRYVRGGTFEIKDIMFNWGTTALPYVPYKEPVEIPIPQDIKKLPNYGKGISAEYCNKADLKVQNFIENTETYELTGNENWTKAQNNRVYIPKADTPINNKAVQDIGICSDFTLVPYAQISTASVGSFCVVSGGGIQFISPFTTLLDWQNYLAKRYEQGNPVTITYAKAESTITSIKRPTWSYKVPYGGFVEIVTNNGKTVPATGSLMYIRHRELDTKIEQLEETIESEVNRLDNSIAQITNEVSSQTSYINTRIDNLTSYTQNEFAYIEGILEQFGVLRPLVSKEVSNIIPVPVRSTRYANINSFGGMTYKQKSNVNIGYEVLIDEVDGASVSIPINNIYANNNFYFYLENIPEELRNKDLIITTAENVSCESESTTTGYYFRLYNEGTITKITIRNYDLRTPIPNILPTLFYNDPDGSHDVDIANYGYKLVDTQGTAIKVHGANLIPYPYTFKSNDNYNGLKVTINDDGTVIIDGTATKPTSLSLYRGANVCKANTQYILSGMNVSGSIETVFFAMQLLTDTGGYLGGAICTSETPTQLTYLTASISNPTEAPISTFYIHVTAGTTVNNAMFKPMFNIGTTALPYTPYRKFDPRPIPDKILELGNPELPNYKGYGKGISAEYCNKVDLEAQTYTRQMETIVLDGVTEGLMVGYTGRTYGTITPTIPFVQEAGLVWAGGVGLSNVSIANANDIILSSTQYTSIDEYNNMLIEQNAIGNPVTITYAKAEPTTEPLPVALEGLVDVESGGYIEFITDNNQPIPVEVEFQVVGEA